jgi:hypothetical protein
MSLIAALVFNLICNGYDETGTPTGTPAELKNHKVIASSWTYRVDLSSMRWCADDCKFIMKIHSISDRLVVLRWSGEGLRPRVFTYFYMGSFSAGDRVREPDAVFLRHGECKQAPFTGFPEGAHVSPG